MRKKKVLWLILSRPLVYIVVICFGTLGMILAVQPSPVIAVAGRQVGIFMQIFLDMLEFACLGI